MAVASFDAGRTNRLVLVSDGGANIGVTDATLIGEYAEYNGGDGIYLVGVGVGEDNPTGSSYNDELMDEVTDLGKGAAVFIDEKEEAWKIFNHQFINTMEIAARNVQVQLDLPPGFEITRFSGEEFSTDPADVEPQHLAPNDSMVFHQQIETCAPESMTGESEVTVTAYYNDPKYLPIEERQPQLHLR